MAAARTQRASSLSVPTHRNAGGDAPSGRPAPPSADNDHHRCRQAEFRAAQCPRKQSSMVKKLTRTVLSAADVGVPVLLLSLLAASVPAFTAPVAGDLDRKSTSELQSLMRSSYDVFCLQKKKNTHKIYHTS